MTGYISPIDGNGLTSYIDYDCDYVAYNPFKYDQFVKITTRVYDGFDATPVHSARTVALLPNREIRAWG